MASIRKKHAQPVACQWSALLLAPATPEGTVEES